MIERLFVALWVEITVYNSYDTYAKLNKCENLQSSFIVCYTSKALKSPTESPQTPRDLITKQQECYMGTYGPDTAN